MKKKWINFIPILGIYYCFKYYFNLPKIAFGDHFDSEEMLQYHFFIIVMLLYGYMLLTNKIL